MTTREFYLAVIEAGISDELTTKAHDLIAGMDSRNEKRKSEDSKEKKEVAARKEAVLTFLKSGTSALTRDQIAEATGLTPGQVTSACSAFVREGIVTKSETKIDKKVKTVYAIA